MHGLLWSFTGTLLMLVNIMCKDNVHQSQAYIEPAQKCKMWHLFSDIAFVYQIYDKYHDLLFGILSALNIWGHNVIHSCQKLDSN